MNTYIISYDLHNSESNRRKVEQSIESIGECLRCLTTTYFVKTPLSQEEVIHSASKYLDGDDGMIVVKVKNPVSGVLKTELLDQLLDFL